MGWTMNMWFCAVSIVLRWVDMRLLGADWISIDADTNYPGQSHLPDTIFDASTFHRQRTP